MSGTGQDETFVMERTFGAPRARVFDAWTRLESLQKWFGPKGVAITAATLDLRPGGVFHYCMRLPDGGAMWGKWTFREVATPERLVSVVAFSDESGADRRAPWEANWPLHTLSDIGFEDLGGRTKLRVAWSPLHVTEAERRVFVAGRDGMQAGWSGTLDRLEEFLAAKAE